MRRHLERLPLFIVAVIVFALPWFFGGVGGAAQLSLSIALTVGWLCAFALWSRTANCWSPLRWPLAIFAAGLLLGAVQASPSIGGWISKHAPAVGAVAADFAAVPIGDQATAHSPLSLHAVSTRRQMAALVMATAAFLLGGAVFGRTRSLLTLLGIITVTAGAVAFFGLLQMLSWNGEIYWKFPSEGGMPFGPFINRNNAGEFLEIGLAAALGLLVWRRHLIPPLPGEGEVYAARGGRNAPISRGTWIVAHVDATLLCCAAAVFLILSGILGTLSRGSFVSLAAGLIGTAAVRAAAGRISAFAWVLVPLLLGPIIFLGWLGRSEAFYQRVQTLFDAETVQGEPRLEHWRTAYLASHDYQPLGAGLGAYRFAYSRMQYEPTGSINYYAENQFLDVLLTGGYVGVGLFLLLWLSLVIAVWRLNREASSPTELGIATTAAFLVLSQTVHACFDFGMYLPAVYVPLALLSGALIRRAADQNRPSDEGDAAPRLGGRLLAMTLGLSVLGALAWSASELQAAWIARAALSDTHERPDSAKLQELKWVDAAISQLRSAVAACPDDGELHVRLSEMLVARYAIAFRDSLENSPLYPAVWQWASVNRLHADAHLLARIRDDDTLAALRTFPLVAEYLKPALAEARLARALCPLAPYGHLLVAKLCFVDESPQNDLFYLQRAERLVGGRVDWLFEIGTLHIDSARLELGLTAWRRCWELSSKYEAAIVRTAAGYLTPEQMLQKLVPADPKVILRIARQYYPDQDQEHLRAVFFRAVLELLNKQPTPSAENCRQAAECAVQLGDLPEAAHWYRRALSLDDSQSAWFFEAAELAVRQGDWETAASHARQALRLAPDVSQYRELYSRAWNEVEAQKSRQNR